MYGPLWGLFGFAEVFQLIQIFDNWHHGEVVNLEFRRF